MIQYSLGQEEREFIIKNLSYSSEQIRQMLKEKYNCDITVDGVAYHLKKARTRAEEATRTADSFISQKISERVDNKVLDFMEMMETEIAKLYDTLQGHSTIIDLRSSFDKDGNEIEGKKNLKDYASLEKLFQEALKNYVALRPQITTVKVEGFGTRSAEDVFLASLTDDELGALEKISKKREKLEMDNENDTKGV